MVVVVVLRHIRRLSLPSHHSGRAFVNMMAQFIPILANDSVEACVLQHSVMGAYSGESGSPLEASLLKSKLSARGRSQDRARRLCGPEPCLPYLIKIIQNNLSALWRDLI